MLPIHILFLERSTTNCSGSPSRCSLIHKLCEYDRRLACRHGVRLPQRLGCPHVQELGGGPTCSPTGLAHEVMANAKLASWPRTGLEQAPASGPARGEQEVIGRRSGPAAPGGVRSESGPMRPQQSIRPAPPRPAALVVAPDEPDIVGQAKLGRDHLARSGAASSTPSPPQPNDDRALPPKRDCLGSPQK